MFVEMIENMVVIDGEGMRLGRIDIAECADCGARRVWNGEHFDCARQCGADPLATVDILTDWNERAFMAENGALCVAVYEMIG